MRRRTRQDRNDPLINGAMIGLGLLGILDNVISHWLLGLHRAVPGPHAASVELALVVISSGLLASGLWREYRARKHSAESKEGP